MKFSSINGNYLKMLGHKKEIIYDLDNTFAKNFDSIPRDNATIVNNWTHLFN